jgi:phenylalanyl-tRNA synthetase beta chain
VPVVAISVKRLNELLKEPFEMEQLVHTLEQLGCDVEDTAEQALYLCPACRTPNEKLSHEEPPRRCDYCGFESDEPFEKIATDEVIRLDLLADRPDLFDVGGLARALKGYLGLETGLSEFPVAEGVIAVEADPAMTEEGTYRPFIECAVVTMPPLDQTSLREIMRLQENLHWGIGRDRKLSSIGVYDLDTLEPPIRYTTIHPREFAFHPLGKPGESMSGEQILKEHPKGIAYAHLMKPYRRYPILMDNKDMVLAMPPIINSDETKCKLGTKRLFIDVTGTEKGPVKNSLDILVSALIELGGQAESCSIVFNDGSVATPDLKPRRILIDLDEANRWLGLNLSGEEMTACLLKMRLDVIRTPEGFEVTYPVFRTDIRHQVDVFEDLAIGYGYDNIQPRLVPTLTIGEQRPEERLSQTVRDVMTGLGYSEIMSLQLQSIERHFTKFGTEPGSLHVVVDNPKTMDQKVLRTHMRTGIMESFHKNRRRAVPQKIFEIGNVIHINPDMETGVNEYRHLSFAVIGPESGYTEGRMVLDAVLHELGWEADYRPKNLPFFTEGRSAEITLEDGLWGILGEIHPRTLNNFGLAFPVTYCELRLMRVI